MRYILLILLVISCGTRKRTVELEKVRTEIVNDIVLKIQNDIRTNTQLTKRGSITVLEPIDPDKPSTFNGHTFQNAKVRIDSTRTDSIVLRNDNSRTEASDNSKVKIDSKNRNVDVKSKKPNPWLWIGLVLVVALGLYLWFKRKR